MRSATLVPVEEYLRTVYEPDMDYVDGELEDRNVGEKTHAMVQFETCLYLRTRYKQQGVYAFIETRMRLKPARYRVPDVAVFVGNSPQEEIFTTQPFIVIEILSPEDRASRMQRKIDDYLNFGVKYVWVIDPLVRRAWVHTSAGAVEAKDGVLRTENPRIELPLADIFAAIDASERGQ